MYGGNAWHQTDFRPDLPEKYPYKNPFTHKCNKSVKGDE